MSGVMQERKLEGKSKEILLKALALRSIEDIPKIQEDVTNKTIVILKVTPLAQKSLGAEVFRGAALRVRNFRRRRHRQTRGRKGRNHPARREDLARAAIGSFFLTDPS